MSDIGKLEYHHPKTDHSIISHDLGLPLPGRLDRRDHNSNIKNC